MVGGMEGKCRSLQSLSVRKAEEKRGDLVSLVATTIQSFHAKEINYQHIQDLRLCRIKAT